MKYDRKILMKIKVYVIKSNYISINIMNFENFISSNATIKIV